MKRTLALIIVFSMLLGMTAFGAEITDFERVGYASTMFVNADGSVHMYREHEAYYPANGPEDVVPEGYFDKNMTSYAYFSRQIAAMPKVAVDLYNRDGGRIVFGDQPFHVDGMNVPCYGLFWHETKDIDVCVAGTSMYGYDNEDLSGSAFNFAHEMGHFMFQEVKNEFTDQDNADLRALVGSESSGYFNGLLMQGYNSADLTDESFANAYAAFYGNGEAAMYLEYVYPPEVFRLMDRVHEIAAGKLAAQ